MRFVARSLVLAVLVAGPTLKSAHAEDAGKAMYAASATDKFVNLPGLPTCMKASVLSGDPTKGAFLLLVKTATGCVIPWHWHTTTEPLMLAPAQETAAPQHGASVLMLHDHSIT